MRVRACALLAIVTSCSEPAAQRPPTEDPPPAALTPVVSRPLTPATERLVAALPEDVELTFVVEDIAHEGPPSPWDALARDFARSYRAAGLSVRVLEVGDANVAEVRRLGIERRSEGYRGAVVRRGERAIVLPHAPDDWWLEYEIARLLRPFAPPPYVIGIARTAAPLTEARRCLTHPEIREVDLSRPIDPALRAVLVIEPEPLGEAERTHLRAYLADHGSVGIFGVGVRLSEPPWEGGSVALADFGLAPLLDEWGVTTTHDMLFATAPAASRTYEGREHFWTVWPAGGAGEMDYHPGLERGRSLRFPFAVAMSVAPREDIEAALVDGSTWIGPVPDNVGARAARAARGASAASRPLAVFLRRGRSGGRLFVSSADFVRDDLAWRRGCDDDLADYHPRAMFTRVVDWLALDVDLVDIGPAERDIPIAF
jgi:hypothetical protein